MLRLLGNLREKVLVLDTDDFVIEAVTSLQIVEAVRGGIKFDNFTDDTVTSILLSNPDETEYRFVTALSNRITNKALGQYKQRYSFKINTMRFKDIFLGKIVKTDNLVFQFNENTRRLYIWCRGYNIVLPSPYFNICTGFGLYRGKFMVLTNFTQREIEQFTIQDGVVNSVYNAPVQFIKEERKTFMRNILLNS